jgi:phosphate transport system protein
MSPRIHYQKELKDLSNSLYDMTETIKEHYKKLFDSLAKQEWDEVEEIAASGTMFSDMQRIIEAKCLYLTARQQPMAGDLRMITATMKAVANLERVGDQISDIAELFILLDTRKSVNMDDYAPALSEMIVTTGKMLNAAVEVFFSHDSEEANSIVRMDDEVDDLFNKLKLELINHLKNSSKDADECVDLLMVAKHMEKIGDYAEDIARWQIFRETGNMKDVRLL